VHLKNISNKRRAVEVANWDLEVEFHFPSPSGVLSGAMNSSWVLDEHKNER